MVFRQIGRDNPDDRFPASPLDVVKLPFERGAHLVRQMSIFAAAFAFPNVQHVVVARVEVSINVVARIRLHNEGMVYRPDNSRRTVYHDIVAEQTNLGVVQQILGSILAQFLNGWR